MLLKTNSKLLVKYCLKAKIIHKIYDELILKSVV